ncbi:hypothetical protein [Fortiea contorta]|nr:hypothetical protein [Fortiea contorta]
MTEATKYAVASTSGFQVGGLLSAIATLLLFPELSPLILKSSNL